MCIIDKKITVILNFDLKIMNIKIKWPKAMFNWLIIGLGFGQHDLDVTKYQNLSSILTCCILNIDYVQLREDCL